MLAAGVDIGGTSIKAALFDLERGAIAGCPRRTKTPKYADIQGLTRAAAELLEGLAGKACAVGVGFPAVICGGVATTSKNVAAEWEGIDVGAEFARVLGLSVSVLNDADAAGVAEAWYGAGRGMTGTVAVVTLGTGVGTALVRDGRLVPNLELSCLAPGPRRRRNAASNAARKRSGRSWEAWARHVDAFLHSLEEATNPDLIVIAGGASKHAKHFLPRLTVGTAVRPAAFRNYAGVAGAAAWTRYGGRGAGTAGHG